MQSLMDILIRQSSVTSIARLLDRYEMFTAEEIDEYIRKSSHSVAVRALLISYRRAHFEGNDTFDL
ncbi:MAG: hypothetical protein IJV98_05150 [Clostridia bacterium]|nr:hypothetical protein [Clostridia bacterium]